MTDSDIKKENMQISAENDIKPAPTTVKLPAFTPTDAEYWFALVENIFRRVGIKDNATKYLYAVAELPSLDSLSPSITSGSPVCRNLSTSNKHSLIKNILWYLFEIFEC